jgi:two-component system phosphate regulon response regulator PhoB
LKILVIEDNPDIKDVLDYILQDEGHEAVPCSDGSSLTKLDEIKPDLILMDELLIGVRGSDLIKQLKSDKTTSDIPVVLISAVPNLKNLAEKCGADAYLEKPFNIDNLITLLKNFS